MAGPEGDTADTIGSQDEVTPESPLAHQPAEPQFQLAGQQIALYRTLASRSPRLAARYLGARIALADSTNPEHLVQAAHSIRELVDDLHTISDLPAAAAPASDKRLSDAFSEMETKWERAKKQSECHADGEWKGEIDEPAQRAFRAVEAAIEWNREERPRRRETYRLAIRSIDVSERTLPGFIEERFIELWDECRTYFIKVCHHGIDPTDEEFTVALEEFERFVLERLNPRTYEDQATLDEIIEEAESGT
jgi:hypothetical protein